MAKPTKNVRPKPAPPVAPAEAGTPAPVSSGPTATPKTSAPPPPPPANQPEKLTPPAPAKATAKETKFVRVKTGPAPVSEGGLIHQPHTEFTIPRERLKDLADIVTYVADVAD